MQDSDAQGFERAMIRLCAGFNVPFNNARRDAYWRSFRKVSLLEFTGLIDIALVESSFATMPTVGALSELHQRQIQAGRPRPKAHTGKAEPTIQEQLCAYATLAWHGRLTPTEFALPWTFVYREWTDTALETPFNRDGRGAECIGVVIERHDGTKIGISAESMLADLEGHAKALRSFKPGPKPPERNPDAWRSNLPDLHA